MTFFSPLGVDQEVKRPIIHTVCHRLNMSAICPESETFCGNAPEVVSFCYGVNVTGVDVCSHPSAGFFSQNVSFLDVRGGKAAQEAEESLLVQRPRSLALKLLM